MADDEPDQAGQDDRSRTDTDADAYLGSSREARVGRWSGEGG